MVNVFTTAPVLWHLNHTGEVFIVMDATNYASVGVSSRYDNKRVIHQMADFFKKYTSAERNYTMYDMELMALIKELREWRVQCEGAVYFHQLVTDHKKIEYVMGKKLLN